MKLLAAAMGLAAATAVTMDPKDAYIPWDCYQESNQVYGNGDPADGSKETDKDRVSALDPVDHRLTHITTCEDRETGTLTGVTSIWAKWENGERTDIKRLNTIGAMSAMYEWDRNGALVEGGEDPMNNEQLWAFEPYWFQEAAPYSQRFYVDRSTELENDDNYAAWRLAHQTFFVDADTDGNGELSYAEADSFLNNVRTYQQNTGYVENWGQTTGANDISQYKKDRHWAVLSLMSNPTTSFTFQDWLRAEKAMEIWMKAGLMEATGHAYGNSWEYTLGDNSSPDYGETLKNWCQTFVMPEGDRLVNVKISSGDHGVQHLMLQTEQISSYTLGVTDNSQYSYENTNWVRFDAGVKRFAGFWGMADDTTGKLNAIGFLEEDVACTDKFKAAVSEYNWTAIIPGTEVGELDIPDNVRLEDPEEVGDHDHTKTAESGVVAGNIIVYCAIFGLMLYFLITMCKNRKK